MLSIKSYRTMSQLNLFWLSFQVPAEQAQILAKPVALFLDCNGAVREVTVSKDEPEWSINFKKALIVLFQAKVDSYSWELEQNRVNNSFSNIPTILDSCNPLMQKEMKLVILIRILCTITD